MRIQATETEMLAAISALVGAASDVMNMRPRACDADVEQLEDAYRVAGSLLRPNQWGTPAFITLVELVDAASAVIERRRHGFDHSDTEAALASAVAHGEDFLARYRRRDA
jgi:hypothetical protein